MDALLWTARQPPQMGMRDWLATWLIMGSRSDDTSPRRQGHARRRRAHAGRLPRATADCRGIPATGAARSDAAGHGPRPRGVSPARRRGFAVARRTAFRRHRRSFDAPDPGGPGTGARRSEAMGGTGPRHAVG